MVEWYRVSLDTIVECGKIASWNLFVPYPISKVRPCSRNGGSYECCEEGRLRRSLI